MTHWSIKLKNKAKLFVVCACSGAGKTELVKSTINSLKDYNLQKIITYTSKNPRVNEKNGVDYFFVDLKEFQTKVKENFFLEWSNAYGDYYGLARQSLDPLKEGTHLIVILDYKGVESIKQYDSASIAIWIDVVGRDILYNRLINRATDNNEIINQRLNIANEEIKLMQNNTLFDYKILNDDFNRALTSLTELIRKEISY